MVFLKDDATAAGWHGGDLQNHTVFTLEDAVQFGARFFIPLLA
jgi:mercuric reductase